MLGADDDGRKQIAVIHFQMQIEQRNQTFVDKNF